MPFNKHAFMRAEHISLQHASESQVEVLSMLFASMNAFRSHCAQSHVLSRLESMQNVEDEAKVIVINRKLAVPTSTTVSRILMREDLTQVGITALLADGPDRMPLSADMSYRVAQQVPAKSSPSFTSSDSAVKYVKPGQPLTTKPSKASLYPAFKPTSGATKAAKASPQSGQSHATKHAKPGQSRTTKRKAGRSKDTKRSIDIMTLSSDEESNWSERPTKRTSPTSPITLSVRSISASDISKSPHFSQPSLSDRNPPEKQKKINIVNSTSDGEGDKDSDDEYENPDGEGSMGSDIPRSDDDSDDEDAADTPLNIPQAIVTEDRSLNFPRITGLPYVNCQTPNKLNLAWEVPDVDRIERRHHSLLHRRESFQCSRHPSLLQRCRQE